MKTKLWLIPLMIVGTIMYSSIAFGWGENSHAQMTDQVFNASLSLCKNGNGISHCSLILQTIENNIDACYTGLVYPDVGIFYYYSNFQAYAGLHSYSLVDKMLAIATTDRQRAFAYCWKIHLAEDTISHNFFVPEMINKYKIPNYIIHPIVELDIEGKHLYPKSNHYMENHAEFDAFVAQASGKDWSSDADKLNFLIGGGTSYINLMKGDSSTWFGTAENWLYNSVGFFVSDSSSIDYIKLAKQQATDVLNGQTNNLDPSGELSLKNADSSSEIFTYLGTFVGIILLFGLGFHFNWIWKPWK